VKQVKGSTYTGYLSNKIGAKIFRLHFVPLCSDAEWRRPLRRRRHLDFQFYAHAFFEKNRHFSGKNEDKK